MSRSKKDKIEYVLELKDLETLSVEEILEKYGRPSRRISSRIYHLRMTIETYDFPSPPDWFEANGDHIHEISLYSEDHDIIETCKHFRIFYTVQNRIREYKKAHPEFFKIQNHSALPDITSAIIDLFEKYKDVEKVMDVFIEELHLEHLVGNRQTTIRNRVRSDLEKYNGEVVHTKSKIFKDIVYGELSREFIMGVIEHNRVNGYEACKEKYFVDRDFTHINSGMYGICKRFNIDTDLWILPIRDSEFNLQREKTVEMINYYYKHGADAVVKKFDLTNKKTVARLVYDWKKRFGLVEMYIGKRAPRVKKGA